MDSGTAAVAAPPDNKVSYYMDTGPLRHISRGIRAKAEAL